MPWVWTDELAELMDQDHGVAAADLRTWRAQPIGLAVPPECDLVSFGHSLLNPSAPSGPCSSPSETARCRGRESSEPTATE